MEKLKYFFGEALRNLWKNRVMSLASFGVLAVCLVLLGSSLLVSYNIKKVVTDIEGQNQVMVFLNDNLGNDRINEIGKEIAAMPNVRQCVFVSKQEALQQQKQILGKDADILNGYDVATFLPNAYRVSFYSMAGYDKTIAAISKLSGILKIQQHRDVALRLLNIERGVRRVSTVLFVLLVFVSLFIIANTIKLALYVRKREINIMKFVGATDWFIRWPFIFEGMLIGVIAGLIAFGVQIYVYLYPFTKTMSNLGLKALALTSQHTWLLLGGFVAVGIVVGALGSMISVRKYLRV